MMNQQLRQLAEKAGIKLTNGSYSLKVQADEGSLTEFAELIVRECAKVELYWLSNQDQMAVATRIKDKFGVK